MTWSFDGILGDAEKAVEHDFSGHLGDVEERTREIIQAVEEAVKHIAEKFGGHISISANGHTSPLPTPGDNVAIHVAFVPKPGSSSPAPAAEPAQAGQTEWQDPDTVTQDPTPSPSPSSGPDEAPQVVPLDTSPESLPTDEPPLIPAAGPQAPFVSPPGGWPQPSS